MLTMLTMLAVGSMNPALADDQAKIDATLSRLGSACKNAVAASDTCGPVRRLEQGRVVGVPGDYYDPLLLAACGPDWRAVGLVVGTAMAHCRTATDAICRGTDSSAPALPFWSMPGALRPAGRAARWLSAAYFRHLPRKVIAPSNVITGRRGGFKTRPYTNIVGTRTLQLSKNCSGLLKVLDEADAIDRDLRHRAYSGYLHLRRNVGEFLSPLV